MITIKVFEQSEINSDEIFLSEISELIGNDYELIETLKNISIGTAPLPEEVKGIYENTIMIHLRKHHVDLSKVVLMLPKNAVVTRKSMEVTVNHIEKIVRAFLKETMPWDWEKVKIGKFQANVEKVLVPEGRLSYEVVPSKQTDYLGTIPLCVNIMVDDQPNVKVWASVDISVITEVVAARKPLGRYQLIGEDDIHLVKMNLAELPCDAMTDLGDALGKRTKRMIRSKTVLRPDLLELPPVVKRGSIVSIIAEAPGIKVTALGKVKEKGRKGQVIQVENLDSNKGIYARVLDSNTVVVDF